MTRRQMARISMMVTALCIQKNSRCFANKVAFYTAESVQDLTEVMEQSVDVRASIDFFVRTTSEILDDLSVIEQVEVEENIKIDESDILTRQYTIAVESNGGK